MTNHIAAAERIVAHLARSVMSEELRADAAVLLEMAREYERFRFALATIADLPLAEQDAFMSANMRKIARVALKCFTL